MTRGIHRLSALAISKASKYPAQLSDGGNLYLNISKTGAKSWVFIYETGGCREKRGRRREMGLGPLHAVSLVDARSRAAGLRKILIDGGDPLEVKKLERRAKVGASITFAEAAEQYIKTHRATWKNAKHAEQWTNSLAKYVITIFGNCPVSSIDTPLVLKCLEPIWETKTETATRVRGRIEAVLDWAAVKSYRSGENPARWKGHLEHLLGNPTILKNTQHMPALPYSKIGDFFQILRKRDESSARMLEFTVLTAVRSGEARGTQWGEIDFDNAVWTIPGERMKMKKEHRVPLSPRAIEILRDIRLGVDNFTEATLVFPGPKKDKPFSDAAMTALLERMGYGYITVHGFRSSFRDWASETTEHSTDVCEMALAHSISNAVEGAYRRGDLFAKRTLLMNDWCEYCNTPSIKADES